MTTGVPGLVETAVDNSATKTSSAIVLNAYESPIHELSYAVLLVSILQVFFEIW